MIFYLVMLACSHISTPTELLRVRFNGKSRPRTKNRRTERFFPDDFQSHRLYRRLCCWRQEDILWFFVSFYHIFWFIIDFPFIYLCILIIFQKLSHKGIFSYAVEKAILIIARIKYIGALDLQSY